MSNTVFNARFTPTASSTLSANTFQVVADIFDGSGTYSGLDVGLDDVVFLDTFNSITSPNSVSRYIVQSLISTGLTSVEVVLRYEDTGTPVDPAEVIGNPGFVARASASKMLAYHAAPTVHTIPDYVVQYARNYDSYVILESELSLIDSSVLKGLFTNGSGNSITAFTLVRQDNFGNVYKVDPSVESDVSSIVGLMIQTTANGAAGMVAFSGLVKNVTTGFAVGDVIYLSKSGGLTVITPEIGVGGFVAGDFVVKVGKITKNSTNGSFKDFKVEVEVRGQL